MKTRIQEIELNNGEKKFVCQERGCNIDSELYSLRLLTALVLSRRWTTLKRKISNPDEAVHVLASPYYEDAIFNNFSAAANFLELYIDRKCEQKEIKFGKQVKKITNIKYP